MRQLSDLEVGDSGVLIALDLPPGVQNHLMYMGFVPDAQVKVLHRAPIGDPTVYSVDGIEIALRRETAKAIRVNKGLLHKTVEINRDVESGSTRAEIAHELVEAGR